MNLLVTMVGFIRILSDNHDLFCMKKILVIDDDNDFRKMLSAKLTKSGFAVVEAENGVEGIRRFTENEVDLVVTDIIMPEKEGMETILELKKIDPALKIIAVSGGGRSAPEDYLSVSEYFGAVKSFRKPFNLSEFVQTINNLI